MCNSKFILLLNVLRRSLNLFCRNFFHISHFCPTCFRSCFLDRDLLNDSFLVGISTLDFKETIRDQGPRNVFIKSFYHIFLSLNLKSRKVCFCLSHHALKYRFYLSFYHATYSLRVNLYSVIV